MRFSANISMLFKEVPFVQRFQAAADAGFTAVEFWWPDGENLAAVHAAARVSRVQVVLLNFYAGDMAAGDRGVLSYPERQHLFKENVPIALDLAERIECPRVNALVGVQVDPIYREAQLDLAERNVRWAADQAAERGITICIEAVNTFENGPYLLSNTADAVEFIQAVDRPNVRLQYDAYHMQRMEGNLVATLQQHMPLIEHIQVADSPARGEPGTGEINYRYVFDQIESLGYGGFIGLEYKPTTPTTEESLRWLPRDARGRDVSPEELKLYVNGKHHGEHGGGGEDQ